MNLKRAIRGFLLSFVFLIFFVYMIFGLQLIFDNSLQNQNNKNIALSDISGSITPLPPFDYVQCSDSEQTAVKKNNSDNQRIEEFNITAQSAISIESNLQDTNKVLFEKDSNLRLPIASLTKLMTAVVILDNYNLSDNVVVDKVADSQDPINKDVKLGDKMPVESFLEIMLVGSSNKSAYALSELVGEQKFVGLMNQKAKDLGLQNTFFADPTGLSPNNISTANDLTKLAEYILKNYPKIAAISMSKELNVPNFGKITNTNQLLGEIPEIVCSKTGFTGEAKGCLLLILNNPKNNDYLINVILGSDNRFSEMKKIIFTVTKT